MTFFRHSPAVHACLTWMAALLLSAAVASAAQFGNFTYTDNGSDIFITDYPKTVGGALVIPASINGKPVRVIAPNAFSYCYKLTSVSFPASLTTISSDAFIGCTGLTGTLALPANLTTIGRDAFRNCFGLTGVLTLPVGLRSIDSGAFASCSRITSIFIPAQLTGIYYPAQINGNIGEAAFSHCTALQSISVDAANPYYSSTNGVLFQKFDSILMQYPPAKGGAYTVPSNIKQIASSAFAWCGNLTSVTLPAGITTLGDDTFYGCAALTSVTLPATVTSIGARCFSYSTKLQSINIPSSVSSIGAVAFSNCSSLGSASIPSSVASLGAGAFASCPALTSIAVAAGNPKYAAVDGVVFDITKTKLIQFPTGRSGSYTVPANVKEIFDYAFWGSSALTAVRLPTNLEAIGASAFSTCSKLVDIPLPPNLLTIGANAFSDCQALESIRIPATVTSIGIGAFLRCSQLRSAEFRGDAPTMGSSMFSGTASGFEVHYYNDKTGFTEPTWLGFPSVNLGDYVVSPQEISVLDGSGNELETAQSSASFGNVLKGGTSTLRFTIRNSGEADLTNIAAVVTGTDAAVFQVKPIDSTSLWEGDSTSIEVTFRPGAAGMRTATLRISSNDSDENPFEIQLEGTGTVPLAPEITVTLSDETVLMDGSSKMNFGTIPVGDTSGNQLFTITNDGTSPLNYLVVSASGTHTGDFKFSQPATTTLAPGAFTTFAVAFKPTAKGSRGATLHIYSNDEDENPFDIQLEGTGHVPAAPEITVTQRADEVLIDGKTMKNFGKAVSGRKGTAMVFTVTNVGSADLTGLFLSINGTNSRDFKISQPARNSLPAGASTKFKVTFKPTAKGTRSAAIHLRSNDLDENPFDIRLKGKCVE